jgi:hypothetical protein
VGRAARRVGVVGLKGPDPAAVAAWVARTRAAQGLPPSVQDPVVIARVVALLGQARQTGATRSGSKVPRPRTAGETTARSRTAETMDR